MRREQSGNPGPGAPQHGLRRRTDLSANRRQALRVVVGLPPGGPRVFVEMPQQSVVEAAAEAGIQRFDRARSRGSAAPTGRDGRLDQALRMHAEPRDARRTV